MTATKTLAATAVDVHNAPEGHVVLTVTDHKGNETTVVIGKALAATFKALVALDPEPVCPDCGDTFPAHLGTRCAFCECDTRNAAWEATMQALV